MDISRRTFLKLAGAKAGLFGLSSLGCGANRLVDRSASPAPSPMPSGGASTVSYKLEDLLDTPIKERDLNMHVYIQPSSLLWDYHTYRDELFGYVRNFFRRQEIKCNVDYSDKPFKPFSSPNDVGVEIYDSDVGLRQRYDELYPRGGTAVRKVDGEILKTHQGYCATEFGIALIKGAHEDWREEMTEDEWNEFFAQRYWGVSVKEFTLRTNAALICHEALHSLGIFHANNFTPALVERYQGDTPNIMTRENPRFSEECPMGYATTYLQKELMHSSLAGNDTYRAFVDSGRDLDTCLERIGAANNREVVQ